MYIIQSPLYSLVFSLSTFSFLLLFLYGELSVICQHRMDLSAAAAAAAAILNSDVVVREDL